jgi:hypothetical protein
MPNQGGWRIEKKGDPWGTPELLRSTYWSLAEAQIAFDKFLSGKLYSRRLGEGFSLIQK